MSALMAGGLSSTALHLIAMAAMLCDHIWAAGLVGSDLFTCVGRIALPIFAFLLAEGFHRTTNRKRYALRLFLFALISEIPFDLMGSGGIFYPFHQNTFWTLLIAFGTMVLLEKAAGARRTVSRIVLSALTVLGAYVLGFALFVDYYGVGVVTVIAFYFFRKRNFLSRLAQFCTLYYLNTVLLGGLVYPIMLFGREFSLHRQSLALLALPIIWLYQGRQGYHNRALQYFRYAFYPAHLLIIYLLARI